VESEKSVSNQTKARLEEAKELQEVRHDEPLGLWTVVVTMPRMRANSIVEVDLMPNSNLMIC
jgi:hypothetical protein